MRRQIPIVGGFYRDPNRHWSRQDCLNWIPVRAERAGGLTEWQLRDAPGLKPFVQIADGRGGIRGARNVEGKLFVVWGKTLYQISPTRIAIPIGTIPGVGRVSMAHNANGLGNELLVVNGSAGYVYNTLTGAFGKVTDEGYPGATVVDFVDQYLAQIEPQGRYWFHSDLADAHAYNTLDQYQAEGDPDRIVSLLVSHREVLVFGSDTIEPYVNAPSGDGTAPFQRASNTVIECGCSARFSPRRMDSSAFWLDDQRLVRRLDGYSPVILSTEAISGAFAECSAAEISQAYAFTWEGAGHKVYYITVPNRFTFGYDAKTGEWHRRASYGLPHWAVSEIVFWNGKWYACDSRKPRLFELDGSYKLDGCDPLERERTAQVLWADQNPITLDELELLLGEPGEASECAAFPDQPDPPGVACSLDVSYEGGESFPTEVNVILGPGLGWVDLEFMTFPNPDKFEVWIGGVKVLDTGYYGGPSNQSELNANLAGRGLPPETITAATYLGSDLSSWSNPALRDRASFYKSVPDVLATVKVYGPMSGTLWFLSLSCPDDTGPPP